MTTTGLGGTTQPEIDPRVLALDRSQLETLAEISFTQRSLAAGSKAVSRVLGEAPTDDYYGLTFGERNDLVESLFSLHSVYPEVFTSGGFFDSHEEVTEEVLLERLPVILEHKGLPVLYHDVGTSLGKPEDYEQRADLMEEVALALMSHMPSRDFLRDCGIDRAFNGPTIEVLVGKVVGLLDSEKYFLKEAERYEKDLGRRLEEINSDENSTEEPKLERYINFLSTTILMMDEEDRQAFIEEYDAACDKPQTKAIMDVIKALAKRSVEVSADRFKFKASQKREAFDMIMTGQAASYISIEQQVH